MSQKKVVYIAEKPSVARAFAQALGISGSNRNGYIESNDAIVTWCVGHLVTMSYPEIYDPALKRWSLSTLPFLPEKFKYEIIKEVKKQFEIVSSLLSREDVETIYVCTDAGREGEYIYRLVEMMADIKGKIRKRVWIDSQTEEEIKNGIYNAKDLSEYDNLSAAAYLRAKEDYLMGINFSRCLTLRYSKSIKDYLKIDKCVIAVGRVMTCVLGMVVDREREIRSFIKTPYYGLEADFGFFPKNDISSGEKEELKITASWKAVEGSKYFESPLLYNEKGFKNIETAKEFSELILRGNAKVLKCEKKKENKQAPLLYNLAELQNDCSRFFKISPDQTLQTAQELYEKKLITYPRTDARVLSSAVAKEVHKNIKGLCGYEAVAVFAKAVLQHKSHENIAKTKYVNDKAVTDHYAIIPTGAGIGTVKSLSSLSAAVYECICRRFLAIFYPAAVYDKLALTINVETEHNECFVSNYRVLVQKGYLHVLERPSKSKDKDNKDGENQPDIPDNSSDTAITPEYMETLKSLRKGTPLSIKDVRIKESETSPPKRYNSGTLILTMENAGQFIEDEELRAQIKGAGIGTSATRAEILKKLVSNRYLKLNSKTQIITPTQIGEMIYEAVFFSMKPLLNPSLTASWEKGLSGVADGSISEAEYMQKLEDYIKRRVKLVKDQDFSRYLKERFDSIAEFYSDKKNYAGAKKRNEKNS